MDRRDFLKTVAVAGLATQLTGEASAAGYSRAIPAGWTYPVATELLPFGHGVMSGDPLRDSVILWTRITIPDPRGWDATRVTDPQGIKAVDVQWVIARDPDLTQVVRKGKVRTTAARDWTVKVDADRLPAATTLYFAFTALGFRSPVGRTRTAPRPTDQITEMTVAHVACTSWWQDVFNAFKRIGERDDLDLVTHAGDHVYDNSGGHPASRFHAGQTQWETDLDNKDWESVAEARRRYALYYADPHLLAAHLSAPFAVMPDQHDDDGAKSITPAQARSTFFEWTATRHVRPDGSGTFLPSPGPNVNVAVPQGEAARYFYRSLSYGSLADVVLLDVRRFARIEGQQSQVLGDVQWAWLERTLRASKARGATHRVLVNQVNLSQLRAFNLPFAEQFEEAFGINPDAPEGEIYTTAWGGAPDERRRLYRFLRAEGIIDNVVLSGDSHGWFGSDLVEDAQAPNYEPATGGGLLGAVGIEMVGSTMGRPGGQDVIAEELYFAANQGSRGAAYTDAATFDAVYRTQALPAVVGLETAAMAANPNLVYFNWRAEYGHAMVHLRSDRAVVECWQSPQRVVADTATLIAQFSSPVGAPHLGRVLQPSPVTGSRQSVSAPEPRTVAIGDAGGGTTPTRPSGVAPVQAQLPATGFPEPAGYVGVAALVAAAFMTRERRDRT